MDYNTLLASAQRNGASQRNQGWPSRASGSGGGRGRREEKESSPRPRPRPGPRPGVVEAVARPAVAGRMVVLQKKPGKGPDPSAIKSFLQQKEKDNMLKEIEARQKRDRLLSLRAQNGKSQKAAKMMASRTKDNDFSKIVMTQDQMDEKRRIEQELNKKHIEDPVQRMKQRIDLEEEIEGQPTRRKKKRVAIIPREECEEMDHSELRKKSRVQYEARQREKEALLKSNGQGQRQDYGGQKQRRVPPPPPSLDFTTLLKIAEKKQREEPKSSLIDEIEKETERGSKNEVVSRPLTQKQKELLEEERYYREKAKKGFVPHLPGSRAHREETSTAGARDQPKQMGNEYTSQRNGYSDPRPASRSSASLPKIQKLAPNCGNSPRQSMTSSSGRPSNKRGPNGDRDEDEFRARSDSFNGKPQRPQQGQQRMRPIFPENRKTLHPQQERRDRSAPCSSAASRNIPQVKHSERHRNNSPVSRVNAQDDYRQQKSKSFDQSNGNRPKTTTGQPKAYGKQPVEGPSNGRRPEEKSSQPDRYRKAPQYEDEEEEDQQDEAEEQEERRRNYNRNPVGSVIKKRPQEPSSDTRRERNSVQSENTRQENVNPPPLDRIRAELLRRKEMQEKMMSERRAAAKEEFMRRRAGGGGAESMRPPATTTAPVARGPSGSGANQRPAEAKSSRLPVREEDKRSSHDREKERKKEVQKPVKPPKILNPYMDPPVNNRLARERYHLKHPEPAPKKRLPPISQTYRRGIDDYKSQYNELDDEEEDDEDDEMKDFIDDGDDLEAQKAEVSEYIKQIFGYDKNKYNDFDDEDLEESSFTQQMQEELFSSKCGLLEDLKDMQEEELEKKRKARAKKRKRLVIDDSD